MDPSSDPADSAWGAPEPVAETSPKDLVEKEKLIHELISLQSSLRALVERVDSVKGDCEKREAENDMLQTYIDSITKSLAAKSV